MADLARCLAALAQQSQPASEIIVVVRVSDHATRQVLATCSNPRVRSVLVERSGVIAAMNAGIAVAKGEVIALTDDDAAPWPDWLERIEQHFLANHHLGCIGGRDWQYKGEPLALDDGRETRPGELQWWGRIIGQHHWAAPGPPREVAVVKGVNCAYRSDALRKIHGFDERLAGNGAQVHWELSACLALRRFGWRVVFDPAIGVDHFPAQRFDEDQRGRFDAVAQRNMVYNETLLLTEHFRGLQRWLFLIFAIVVGTRGSPGLLQYLRLQLQAEDAHTLARCLATLRGRMDGMKAAIRNV